MDAAQTLPPIVFELISQRVTYEDLPNVRLACRLFAEATAVAGSIVGIRVEAWVPHRSDRISGRLSKVQHMHAVISSARDWNSMQQLAQQLPQLRSLHCSGRRTWYRMSSNQTTCTSRLPALPAATAADGSACALPLLHTAIFEGTVRGLDDIASLLPNVQQLYCSKLMLTRQQEQQQEQHMTGASQVSPQLLQLTHFGSESVHVAAEDAAEAAASFAAAFPALQVLFRTPEFGRNLTLIDHIHKSKVPLREVLARCTALHSLRVFGSTTDMCGLIAHQLAGLQHIKRVCVYGIGPATELKGFRQLTQLQQLQLTLELPAKRAALQLLQELGQLQQLQMLALPAKLLCGSCCPGVRQAVEALAGKCISGGCKVVFLKRQRRLGPQAAQAGDYCQHTLNMELGFFQLVLAATAAAAAASAGVRAPAIDTACNAADLSSLPLAKQLQLREMPQEEPQLPEHVLRKSGFDGVWGLLGPSEEWFR